MATPKFTFDPSLSEWNIPAQQWLTTHDKHWDGLATASLVFDAEGRVLLLQRASHDSMPNLWETPGGAVDNEDASVLHGAARELQEEAGLVANRFTHIVTKAAAGETPGFVFTNRTGTRFFFRITFAADVDDCSVVTLDPNEHQAFVWATEQEVSDEKIGDRAIPITNPQTKLHLLEGFRLRKETSESLKL
ncbi:hypothetical protein GQ53DRAFT_747516 [Thozetella sp. PMI_491]|nr:hypothetical protein GQ53DRAFT_747516 [Thozetella sp. PMI_491]